MHVPSLVPEGPTLDVSYATAVREDGAARSGGLRWIPSRIRRRLIRTLVAYETGVTLEQDRAIWGHRRYVEHPRLVPTDGALLEYRRYCAQFYRGEEV